MSLNPETKIVRQCMTVLELTDALGNVSEACRQRNVSRSSFSVGVTAWAIWTFVVETYRECRLSLLVHLKLSLGTVYAISMGLQVKKICILPIHRH